MINMQAMFCLLMFAANVGLSSGHQKANGKTITIQGEAMGYKVAMERVATMLESDNQDQREMALDILKQNVGIIIDSSGHIEDRIKDTLISLYKRLPAYPPSLVLSKGNVMEIMQSSKVFVFCILVRHGGKKGQALVPDALKGEDHIMRKVALEQQKFLDEALEREKAIGRSEIKSVEVEGQKGGKTLAGIANRVQRVLVSSSAKDKKILLKDLQLKKKEFQKSEYKAAKSSVIAAFKTRVLLEKDLSVQEDMVTTVMVLDESESARIFLVALIENPQASRFLKKHCRYMQELLEQGAFVGK